MAVLFVLLVSGGAFLFLRRSAPSPDESDAWFADVTDEVGLNFVHDAGDLSKYQLPQIHGSGVALFDYDGDGLLDIYMLTAGGAGSRSINRLYRNLGNGTFK